MRADLRGLSTLASHLLLLSYGGVTPVFGEPIPLAARATDAPVVDLGYSTYQGYFDANYSTNVFKGIRYAAAPIGDLRWQAPQSPAENRSAIISATTDPPICPQSGAGKDTPAIYGFVSGPGDEDCLFLNVFAPPNATDLPVFFWIHGGGYSLFSAQGLDAGPLINTSDGGFITVVIQYRLGAFGFLAGEDVKENGVLNAGLLDMNFALQWVQKYISKFGGDPSRVTIGGESAGAAATIFQSLAYGGTQNQSLFNNVIAASTWVPSVYNYSDPFPTEKYDAFVAAAGCSNSTNAFKCLVNTNTTILQNASGTVSEASPFGSFAFLPVLDGSFVQERPTVQLLAKQLQGKRLLAGNNANEGVPLAPPTLTTPEDFISYVKSTFPEFTDDDITEVQTLYSYDGDDEPTDPDAPRWDTNGTSAITAVNQSGIATGQTQRVFNVFAESTFDCPSLWAAEAFPQAWKYQYSVIPAYHGADLQAYWSKTTVQPGTSFKHAFQKIWGSFIINDTPVISVEDAKAGLDNATVPEGADGNIDWPQYTLQTPVLLNLNETGGTKTFVNVTANLQYNIYLEPGITNVFNLADASAWEGGRGTRCEWWRSVAAKIPV